MKQDNDNHAATPGPWRVSTWNAMQGSLQDEHEAAFIVKTEKVVSRFGELEANAQLIAAAPALLEALEHCVNVLAEHDRKPGDDLDGFMLGALDKARTAIAKAKGD